jgi:hypothetical protein
MKQERIKIRNPEEIQEKEEESEHTHSKEMKKWN